MAVPAEDIDEIVADLPSRDRDPDRWALLSAAYEQLTSGVDEVDFHTDTDPWFAAHLFVAAVPYTLALHEGWGVDGDVSWATLAGIGRTIGIHRQLHGTGGVHFPAWFVRHIRGQIFRVGYLEYLRGAEALDLHIPEDRPMTPAAIDDSFVRARAFFARHFPDDDSGRGTCTSWLLDPQLAEYLPEDSNIVRFQRRFRLEPGVAHPGNASVMEFVFRRVAPDLDELPQDTTLQRAVVAHMRDGREWKVRRGWCEISAG
jgi:hypothetical protein